MTNIFSSRINAQELASRLAAEIPAGVGDLDSNPEWTISVRDVLHRIGNEMDFDVWSRRTEKNPSCHEWLYDLVWLPKPQAITIELAAESEWDNVGCVLDDFQKLLCAKAPIKALLFSYKTGSAESATVWKRLKQYFNDYPHHIAGEQYILLEFHKDGCRSAVVAVEKSGPQDFSFQHAEIDAVVSRVPHPCIFDFQT